VQYYGHFALVEMFEKQRTISNPKTWFHAQEIYSASIMMELSWQRPAETVGQRPYLIGPHPSLWLQVEHPTNDLLRAKHWAYVSGQ
jgi:hypothetical protein